MIRFGAVVSVVAVAIGLLVAGAVSGTLALVYVSIGLAALALLMLIAGVAIWRDNVFGRAAAGDVRTTSGQPAGTFESEVVGSAAGSGPSRVQPAEERQLAREYARGRTATFAWSAETLPSADEHGSPPPVGRGERAPSMSGPVFEPAAGRTARDRRPVVNRPVVNEPAAEHSSGDLREPDRPLTTLAGTGRGQAQRPGADRPGADRPGADRPRQASTAQRWLATDPAVPVTGREPARQAAESATVVTNAAGTTSARPAEASATAAADRAPADRAPADRAPADRAPADRATADRATADRATADRATADRAAAEPAAGEVAGGNGSVDQLADSAQVSVVPGIARYHKADCILIRFLREEDLQTMTRHEAEAAGNVPCKACKPDKVAADG